ncbi:MAG: hypothetical protein HY360_04095 [Verrucomicrobia bacterium]|nr:hypothetical protein [Verrucomicrobiota bacterium]
MIHRVVFLVCFFAGLRAAAAQSAWLPDPGDVRVTASYSYQTFEDFWVGTRKMTLPSSVEQQTVCTGLDWGLTQDFALDLSIGYTSTYYSQAPETDEDGLADTRFGGRWRFLDEFEHDDWWTPTLALRAGGIVEGTYATPEAGTPNAPGDGASGMEISLLWGKTIGKTGFGFYGDLGYRNRNESVPDDFFFSAGVYKTFLKSFSANFGFRHVEGLSGLDIGGPGFAPDRFPETREINESIDYGLGYTDQGRRYYGVFGSNTLDGRNTGENQVMGVTISLPF